MGFLSRLTGRKDSVDPEPAQPSGVPEFLPEAVPSADASRGDVPEFSSGAGEASPGVRLYNPYQVSAAAPAPDPVAAQPPRRARRHAQPHSGSLVSSPLICTSRRLRVSPCRASMQLPRGAWRTGCRPTSCRSSRSSCSARKLPCTGEAGARTLRSTPAAATSRVRQPCTLTCSDSRHLALQARDSGSLRVALESLGSHSQPASLLCMSGAILGGGKGALDVLRTQPTEAALNTTRLKLNRLLNTSGSVSSPLPCHGLCFDVHSRPSVKGRG